MGRVSNKVKGQVYRVSKEMRRHFFGKMTLENFLGKIVKKVPCQFLFVACLN